MAPQEEPEEAQRRHSLQDRAQQRHTVWPPSSANVNRTLGGWFEYFKHSHKWTFPTLDSWVRRRLRSILRKRSKGFKGISRGL